MPRACAVCSNPHRAELELQLAEGVPFAVVSREARWPKPSPDSLERHWRNHVQIEIRDSLSIDALPATTLAERMLDLGNETTMIRKRAVASGDDRLALTAIKVESELLSKTADRMGITPDTAQLDLEQAQTVFTVLGKVARLNPRNGEYVARLLDEEDRELAEAVRRVARAAELKQAEIEG